jgi:hypothetical protein
LHLTWRKLSIKLFYRLSSQAARFARFRGLRMCNARKVEVWRGGLGSA